MTNDRLTNEQKIDAINEVYTKRARARERYATLAEAGDARPIRGLGDPVGEERKVQGGSHHRGQGCGGQQARSEPEEEGLAAEGVDLHHRRRLGAEERKRRKRRAGVMGPRPYSCLYAPECVEGRFSEVRSH